MKNRVFLTPEWATASYNISEIEEPKVCKKVTIVKYFDCGDTKWFKNDEFKRNFRVIYARTKEEAIKKQLKYINEKNRNDLISHIRNITEKYFIFSVSFKKNDEIEITYKDPEFNIIEVSRTRFFQYLNVEKEVTKYSLSKRIKTIMPDFMNNLKENFVLISGGTLSSDTSDGYATYINKEILNGINVSLNYNEKSWYINYDGIKINVNILTENAWFEGFRNGKTLELQKSTAERIFKNFSKIWYEIKSGKIYLNTLDEKYDLAIIDGEYADFIKLDDRGVMQRYRTDMSIFYDFLISKDKKYAKIDLDTGMLFVKKEAFTQFAFKLRLKKTNDGIYHLSTTDADIRFSKLANILVYSPKGKEFLKFIKDNLGNELFETWKLYGEVKEA